VTIEGEDVGDAGLEAGVTGNEFPDLSLGDLGYAQHEIHGVSKDQHSGSTDACVTESQVPENEAAATTGEDVTKGAPGFHWLGDMEMSARLV
jgi:hypothetical protein